MPAAKALELYNRKRNFKITSEPPGTLASKSGQSFVIQKHAASHLHYDFRLEAAGVLKSWAVPKGPSMDVHVKRLAMQTEDHPLRYASFEGIIPAGQYGGGQVIVWDRGTYQNTTTHRGVLIPLEEGIQNGHISFRLNGEKLKGGFALTRTARPGAKNAWLMVKMNDAEANTTEDPVSAQPQSVLSGKNVEDLSEKNSRIWISNRPPKQHLMLPSHSPTVKMPSWIDPMLATLVERPFDRKGWIFEPKLDGERCLAYRQDKTIQLYSRNKKLINVAYPELIKTLKSQTATSFIVDGEIVAFGPHSSAISSFRELQKRMHLKDPREVKRSPVRIFYYLFDILFLNGQDLRQKPLIERKQILAHTFHFDSVLRLHAHRDTHGERYYHEACKRGGEGLIAKRADSSYVSGRSRDWLKFKCVTQQEFVIGGYTKPHGSRHTLGALLLGYYEGTQLKFAGKVGTGFDATALNLLAKTLLPLETKQSPFDRVDMPLRHVHWTTPKLVCEVVFSEWTEEGKLRHPRYIGLRDDKPALEVKREKKMALTDTGAMEPMREKAPSVKRPKPNASGELEIDHKKVSLSHVDKIFYPSTGFTKGQVLDYYIKVAATMLPYLKGRPVTMKRYPNGVEDAFFYEKQVPSYRPSWLKTYAMKEPKTGKMTEYAVITDMASLIWMANLACLEFHVLLAQAPKIDSPTMVVFDLDPGPGVNLLDCIKIGLEMRQMFKTLKLQAFPKTSGNKGLHLYLPLNDSKMTYDQTHDFALSIAHLLERHQPGNVVSNMRKELRQGKVLVDWSQNNRHKTTVAAYSLRAQEIPSVSTPVSWDELENALKKKNLNLLRFTPAQVLDRLKKNGDIFSPVYALKQKLPFLDPKNLK